MAGKKKKSVFDWLPLDRAEMEQCLEVVSPKELGHVIGEVYAAVYREYEPELNMAEKVVYDHLMRKIREAKGKEA